MFPLLCVYSQLMQNNEHVCGHLWELLNRPEIQKKNVFICFSGTCCQGMLSFLETVLSRLSEGQEMSLKASE